MAGALAGAPPGLSTRISSSAVLSGSTQRHRFQTSPSRAWRKDRSGLMPDAAIVVSATSDREVLSRREAMSLSAAGLGAFLLMSGVSRADGATAAVAAEDLREGAGPYPHEESERLLKLVCTKVTAMVTSSRGSSSSNIVDTEKGLSVLQQMDPRIMFLGFRAKHLFRKERIWFEIMNPKEYAPKLAKPEATDKRS